MKIGQLSLLADCAIETIRYYEKIGLLPPPARTEGGYRLYEHSHLKRLVFVRRSRELGFTLEEIRALLQMVDGGNYSCGDIQKLALEHAESIRRKMADLKKLEKTLTDIASHCSGSSIPDCPIIDALFEEKN